MQPTNRSQLHLRIIGYFNIFIGQRMFQSGYVAFYVICANIVSLVFVPIFFIYVATQISYDYESSLETFSDTVDGLISFVAVACSVLTRGQRERVHMEIAESIIALDQNYFIKVCGNKVPDTSADGLLYFKMFALGLQTIVPFFDSLTDIDELSALEVLRTSYFAYLQAILAASLLMYFYLMWLLRKRFCWLNMKMKSLLRQLQQTSRKGEAHAMTILEQRWLVAEASANLVEISQIHTILSRLLVRLNAGYKYQIITVLLAYLIDGISFGYYLTLTIDGTIEWEFDFETILFCCYAAILFADLNLVYWISDMTMDSHGKMAQILRSFQILPPLGDGFEQQCELFALQLQLRNRSIRIAGMFQLNRQSALALWTFVLAHVIVLIQFDLESRLDTSTENLLLKRFNQFFRTEVD